MLAEVPIAIKSAPHSLLPLVGFISVLYSILFGGLLFFRIVDLAWVVLLIF